MMMYFYYFAYSSQAKVLTYGFLFHQKFCFPQGHESFYFLRDENQNPRINLNQWQLWGLFFACGHDETKNCEK
jgi:hypothetical protein